VAHQQALLPPQVLQRQKSSLEGTRSAFGPLELRNSLVIASFSLRTGSVGSHRVGSIIALFHPLRRTANLHYRQYVSCNKNHDYATGTQSGGPTGNVRRLESGGYQTRCTDTDFVRRWKYLEAGVSRVMINLQDGIDMQTVSALHVP
jgi:hypothetical protein